MQLLHRVANKVELVISLPLDFLPRTNSVAVVRLDALGDFVIWAASARYLRDAYPQDRIVLYANKMWADFAKEFDYWDEVVAVDRAHLHGRNSITRLAVLLKVRRRRYRVALQPTFSREIRYGDSIIRATAAAFRIGYDGDCANITEHQKAISDTWYTHLVPSAAVGISEFHRNKHFMQSLGVAIHDEALAVLPVRTADVLDSLPGGSFVVVAPGSSRRVKNWPVERFVEIAHRIAQDTSNYIVLCGTEGDGDLCAQIQGKLGVKAINLCGMTTQIELVQVLRAARLVICNDSSFVHIAAAVGTRSVVILGGGHYGRFMPYPNSRNTEYARPTPVYQVMECYGCNWKCIFNQYGDAPFKCIDEVEIDAVWFQVRDQLLNTAPQSECIS